MASFRKQQLSLMTGLSAFLMGYLDVFSLHYNQAKLISAQTGNLVSLGIKLADGTLDLKVEGAIVLGFAVGCLTATLLDFFWEDPDTNLLKKWGLFSGSLFLYTLVHAVLFPPMTSLFLSFLAGLALTFFDFLADQSVNNGIMTGNLKKFYVSLAQFFKKKNPQMRVQSFWLAMIIALFFVGVCFAEKIYFVGARQMLLFSNVICLLPYFLRKKA